jgi:serine/threonine protein kinase
VRHIGQGGYSDISLVFSKKYNQYFALKQNRSHSKSELLNERKLLIQLDHPNIINLYSMIEVNTIDCLVFEYCSERSLTDVVEAYGPIQPPQLYNYCFQILSAIENIHQIQIAHGDINHSNILLNSYDRIKVTDFGISQKITENSKSEFHGSKMLSSPEIWMKVDDYDRFLADIYSLGVTFYYMTEGKYPFNTSDSSELRASIVIGNFDLPNNVETSFREIIIQMMKLDPKQRLTISQLINHPIFHSVSRKQTVLSQKSRSLSFYCNHSIHNSFVNRGKFHNSAVINEKFNQ